MNIRSTSFLVLIAILISSVAIMISIPGSGQVRSQINEGTITMEADEGDDVTEMGYPILTAIPGQELEYRIWLNNDHELEQTVIMEMQSPEDWNIYITGSVKVPGQGRNSILLDVSIPKDMMMDPEGEFQIRIDGIANITGDRAFIIAVVRLEAEVDHELLIYPDAEKEMEVQVYPGQRSYMEILLRNQGDIIDDLTLKIMEHQSSWDARFQDEEDSFMVTLPPGSSDSIFITRILIGVPETSKVGDSQTISIYSSSEMFLRYGTGKATDRIDLIFRVVNPSTISIHPKKAMLEAESGSPLDLQFDLIHTGVLPSTIDPQLKVLSGSFEQSNWQYTIDIGDSSTLEVGETRIVMVQLLPPKGTSGDFDITLGGRSDNAKVIEGSMTVMLTSGSNITYTDLEISDAKIGSDVIIKFRVLNNGDSTSQIVLDLKDLPTCFISSIDPSSFSLGPGTSRGIIVVLYPRNNEVPLQFSFHVNIKVPLEENKEWVLATDFEVPVKMMELPNIAVRSIILPNRPIDEGETVQVNITVLNPSNIDMNGISLELYEISYSFSNNLIGSIPISLSSGDEITFKFNWTARPSTQKIRAILVPSEGSEESEINDNDLTEPINVIPKRTGSGDAQTGGDPGEIDASTAVAVAVGGSVILTSLALFINTEYVKYPLFASLFPLYSKLKPEHLLSNRLRKRIYVYVQNNPGEHFRSILVNLNLTNGTLAHHLYTLEKENLIRSQKDGLYRRFYPAGYNIEEVRVSLSPIQRDVMALIEGEPGLSQKEISERLSISNSTVNYNIKSLKDKGQIEVRKKGKSTHIYLVPDRNS